MTQKKIQSATTMTTLTKMPNYRMIKLFEQWLAEEDVKTTPKTETLAAPVNPNSYKLSISADNKSFEVEGTSDKEFSSKEAVSFTVSKSTDPSIQANATIMISPKADKDGDFDIIVINDKNTPETAMIYSGKVTKSKA